MTTVIIDPVSPLLPFANGRILWYAPGGRTSGRDGLKIVDGQPYLINVFVKRIGIERRLEQALDIPALHGAKYPFEGYCVAFAALPPSLVADWKTVPLDDPLLTWDYSALLPPGVESDAQALLEFPSAGEITVRFIMKGGRYGFEGIGAIVRANIGDQFYLKGGAIN